MNKDSNEGEKKERVIGQIVQINESEGSVKNLSIVYSGGEMIQ